MNNSTFGNTDNDPFALKIVLRLLYAAIFFVGIFGNLLVCIVVAQQRRMRTVINYLTLNLAISDLILLLIYAPSQLAAYENNQNWPFGHIGCRITYSTIPVCFTTSITTLLVISWERFRGIVFPFQPRMKFATVRWIIIIIWVISVGTAMPLMVVAGTVKKDGNVFCDEAWPNEESSKLYWITMFLVQYVIPLLVMIVLYGIAGWKIERRSAFIASKNQYNINSAAEDTRQRQSHKITKMLVALILLYSFCMLPQHVIYFWTVYGNFWELKHSLYVFRISNLFPMANSALNSIAYGTLQSDFRRAYKKLFKSCNLPFCTKPNRNNSIARKQLKGNKKRHMLLEPPYIEHLMCPETECQELPFHRCFMFQPTDPYALSELDVETDSETNNKIYGTGLHKMSDTMKNKISVHNIILDPSMENTSSSDTNDQGPIFDTDFAVLLKHARESTL